MIGPVDIAPDAAKAEARRCNYCRADDAELPGHESSHARNSCLDWSSVESAPRFFRTQRPCRARRDRGESAGMKSLALSTSGEASPGGDLALWTARGSSRLRAWIRRSVRSLRSPYGRASRFVACLAPVLRLRRG